MQCCAVDMELNQHLLNLDQQEVEREHREAVIQEIINALVSGKKVWALGEEWSFDDVLEVAFEKPQYSTVCYMFRSAGSDSEKLVEASKAYAELTDEAALEVAKRLAPDVLAQKIQLSV